MKCNCGKKLPKREKGGNWGDWKCSKCGQAYCQDCKSIIDMKTMNCTAYEESKQNELTSNI